MGEWEAGQELEAEIARRVMGWQREDGHPPWWWWHVPETEALSTRCAHDGTDTTPLYSTKIEDAWIVVAHFPEMVLEHLSGGWYCWLGDDDADPSRTSTVACTTAPLAICLAALAAINRGES